MRRLRTLTFGTSFDLLNFRLGLVERLAGLQS